MKSRIVDVADSSLELNSMFSGVGRGGALGA